jgi:hypothetical protein
MKSTTAQGSHTFNSLPTLYDSVMILVKMALFQFQCRQTRKLHLYRKTEKCLDQHRVSMATDLQMTCCKLVRNSASTVDTSVSYSMMHCRLPDVRLSILDSCSTVRHKKRCLLVALKFVASFQSWLKSDRSNGLLPVKSSRVPTEYGALSR